MIKPLGDRVVVKVVTEKEATRSGLIISGNSKERLLEGVIVATGKGILGEDKERIPLDVSVADRVLFCKYVGTEFKDGEEIFLILNQEDILGIL
jgi:chaperonin GroES